MTRAIPVARRAQKLVGLIVLVVMSGASLATVVAAPAAAQAAAPTQDTERLCSDAKPGYRACFAIRQRSTNGLQPNAVPAGYGPSQLQSAYKVPTTLGAGKTVAVVDAFDLPTAESDLGAYRSQFGLPPCTTANGCFRKINQNGGTTPPAPDAGWGGEIALDLDMVSATCPNCKILLVEATSASNANLGAAVNQAAAQGAVAISNSYGGPEAANDPTFDNTYYKHPGIAVTASSGDDGFGTSYPAASPYVTAVGGTSLTVASNARGWSESAWSGAGSGCSINEPKPSFQTDSGCVRRTMADVAAVADPNTGVAVYDSYQSPGWQVFGGTSASSPIVASIFAMATAPAAGVYPVQYPYANPGALFDVTTGSNGTCSPAYLCKGGTGYDGPTGLGTPNGVAAFGPGATGNDFSLSVSPASGSVVAGSGTTATVSTSTTAGSAQSVTLNASGLPAGATASFSPATVTSGSSSTLTISTTAATAPGTYAVSITGTGPSATHATAYTLTVNGASGSGITNGGFETGSLSGWTATGAAESVSTASPRSGSYAARLGLTTPTNGDSSIAQTFTAPVGFANLSFWYKMTCLDSVTYAWATATLRDNTSGTTATPLPKTCVTNSAYVNVTANVVAGHNYTLILTNHDDNYPGDPADTDFDDVMLVNAPTCASGQKLGNPGFESGSVSWSATAGVIAQNTGLGAPRSGTWSAWLDGYGSTHTDSVSQAVTIPAGCTNYVLSFYVHISTNETTTATQYDKLTVKLGATTLATYSNLNHSTSYVVKSFNVGAFAGQTVTLTFTGTEDSSLQTSFVIDDTALTTS